MTPAQGGYLREEPELPPEHDREEALQHLLQLIVDELNLGSDDDLASVLARADDTGSAGSLDGLLIDLVAILDVETQTGGAVVNVGDVALAANSSQNTGSNVGEVVVGQLGGSSIGWYPRLHGRESSDRRP